MQKISPGWSGSVTVSNLEATGQAIKSFLTGKPYTRKFQIIDSDSDPEIHTRQRTRSVKCWLSGNAEFASLSISDSYGNWGLSTMNGKIHLSFSSNGKQMVIKGYVPKQYQVVHTIILE